MAGAADEPPGSLDWRPAAAVVLTELDRQLGAGPWQLVPTDGTAAVWSPGGEEAEGGEHRGATDDLGAVSVPIVLPDGSVFATLQAISAEAVEAVDPQRLTAMAGLLEAMLAAHESARVARERAERAETAALADPLTGLLNRRGWWAAVEAETARARRSGAITVVAIIDLDGLKVVNDREGHLAGDVLIRVSAETLRQAMRVNDVLARVGGDEFHVMAVDYRPPEPDALVDRLRTTLQSADIAASIGATIHHPDEPMESALARADAAMYEDKRRRKSR